MEISFEIKKRQVYGVLFFIFLLSVILVVSAYTYNNLPTDFWGHGGDEIIITSPVGGQKDFQQAIVDGDFNGDDLSEFKPTDINQYSFTATSLQTLSIINDPDVKSCLLLKYAEKDVNKVATCSIFQSETEWKIDIENAECGVICLEWNPNPYV